MSRFYDWAFAGYLVALLAFTSPAAAVNKTFTNAFGSNSWDNAFSWTPSGEPTTNDRVFINTDTIANLFSDSAGVDDLYISNSGEVRTGGFLLLVDDGIGAITSISGARSQIVVSPRIAGGHGFDTDLLDINSGSQLVMAGGEAHIDFDLDIFSNGALIGSGLVNIFSNNAGKLSNGGSIRAEGGTLTVRSIGGGTFDLDGGPSAPSLLAAVEGTSKLVIDGVLADNFSTTMNIGVGNTIQFDQVWQTDAAMINFNAGGGVGALGGAQLTHGGTINVNAGTALITAPLVFQSTSKFNIAAGATLDFGTNANNSFGGTVNFNGGATLATAAVIDGGVQTFVGTLNVDGHAQLDAQAVIGTFATVNLFNTEDKLRFANTANIGSGATFIGTGCVVNLAGSTLFTSDFADIDVTLENQGVLDIGDLAGPLEVEGFDQTSTGSLKIELANITSGSWDTLTVQGNATLTGTLDVSLLGGFNPVPGNSFSILETVAGNVSGMFSTENLPVFNDLTLEVVYNPKSVELKVIPVPASGDFDHDGDVDGHDFILWQRGGSPNGINSGDLALWQAQYGTPLTASSTAVPEPRLGMIMVWFAMTNLRLTVGFVRRERNMHSASSF